MVNNSAINFNLNCQEGSQDIYLKIITGLGQWFYFHNVSVTSFKNVEEVPNFYSNAWTYFLILILFENILLYYQNKPIVRINDGITSVSHGIIQECGRLLFRGGESAAYIYIYNNYRFLDLPWDSPWTFYFAFFAVDFCYYWVHRASHEIHIFWAQHQVHHSSEEFNVAVGLRQSFLQGWCSFIFYLPMALLVPPVHFVTHQQFNLMYQVWIHTKTIKNLGPLEYVFNTPKHHRVHHGCNNYCIDKNYGGVFIIWDRLFNTFASEIEKEDIIYGLVYNQPSFNPIFLQVTPRPTYDVKISTWCNLYVSIHFICILIQFQSFMAVYKSEKLATTLVFVGFIMLSLNTIGMLLENHRKAAFFEVLRCFLFLMYFSQNSIFLKYDEFFQFIYILYCGSIVFWSFHKLNSRQI